MKPSIKRFTLAGLSAACALTVIAGVGMLTPISTAAEEFNSKADTYFYDNLVDAQGKEYTLAKKFYDAIGEMHKSGDFVDGEVNYALSDILSPSQLKAYIENGDITVPKAFSAARDAYLTDHPDLFYIDFYKMTISVGRKNGAYVAYIDSGREANLYYDNGFNTTKAVTDAIAKYEAKISEIVEVVTNNQENDAYSARDAYLAREVNRYLAENIDYDYAAYENKDDPNYIAAAYINTSYGGLVEEKAVCGGFSTSYKVIMDRLGIPCITVNGYSNQKDENGNENGASIYHMWNYVWLANPTAEETARAASNGGEWYSVDVTWDSASANKYRYALLNKTNEEKIHVSDGVISSSGYELKYPVLSSHNYGSNGETDGLQCSLDYQPTGSKDDYGNPLMTTFAIASYNGKGAKRLFEEDGLYLAYRAANYTQQNGLNWQEWIALKPFSDYGALAIDAFDYFFRDEGTEMRIYENTSVYYLQFAVFDAEPDVPTHVESESHGISKDFYYTYSDDKLNESNAVYMGEMLLNKSYGTYTPPPYVQSSTPSHQADVDISDNMRDRSITNKVIMAEDKAFVIEITYNEPLHLLNDKEPIGIYYKSEHPNTADYAKFYPINASGALIEIVERPKNSGDPTLIPNTIRFKFAPSLMYEHNRERYHFFFTNVASAKIVTRIVDGKEVFEPSNKLLDSAGFTFSRLYLACPARFNYDGRLWIDCCAQPTLISNSDLSAMDFKDEDGNSTFSENERSQMMLVAEKADSQTVDTMLDQISENKDITLKKDDIKHSETYDISLQICGKYPTIPDGSYVKIALGFPEGYGPEDEGVVFKLFHRKHIKGDEYIIEEIPCVVTQFGIVATVTSFSPYMVAVVDEKHATTDKTIYASIEGKGGTLSKADGQIRTVKKGESYTYSITPDAGYQIYKVSLNGKDVTEQVKNNKLTLQYADLLFNNELEIQYISEAAAKRYTSNEIEKVSPVKVIVSTEGKAEIAKNGDELAINKIQPQDDSNTTLIIIGIVVAVVAVTAVAGIMFVLLKRRKVSGKSKK